MWLFLISYIYNYWNANMADIGISFRWSRKHNFCVNQLKQTSDKSGITGPQKSVVTFYLAVYFPSSSVKIKRNCDAHLQIEVTKIGQLWLGWPKGGRACSWLLGGGDRSLKLCQDHFDSIIEYGCSMEVKMYIFHLITFPI